MDIQDEFMDAVFRRHYPASDGIIFKENLTTTVFINLIYLNFGNYMLSSILNLNAYKINKEILEMGDTRSESGPLMETHH
jgi:hypothetical protein